MLVTMFVVSARCAMRFQALMFSQLHTEIIGVAMRNPLVFCMTNVDQWAPVITEIFDFNYNIRDFRRKNQTNYTKK